MKKISATIITCNEEKKIRRALESLQGVADEIVVVDSGSSDGTEAICREFTDRFQTHSWLGYRGQKQFALQQSRCEWVLSLDGDEALSPELAAWLQNWKRSAAGEAEGYLFPRKTWFLGRWIEHTTWYPDWQLRLFQKGAGCWQGGRVHESVRLQGATRRIPAHLLHYSYATISEFVQQLDRFSDLSAADYLEAGRRAGWKGLVADPAGAFFKNYCLRRGFQDGIPGLAVSVLAAISVFFKHLKLWELEHAARLQPPGARDA